MRDNLPIERLFHALFTRHADPPRRGFGIISTLIKFTFCTSSSGDVIGRFGISYPVTPQTGSGFWRTWVTRQRASPSLIYSCCFTLPLIFTRIILSFSSIFYHVFNGGGMRHVFALYSWHAHIPLRPPHLMEAIVRREPFSSQPALITLYQYPRADKSS